MAKIADVRAASTISSPILSRFLVLLFLLFLRTLGPARLFLFLLNYKATLSDSFFFLPLVFSPGQRDKKKLRGADVVFNRHGWSPSPFFRFFIYFYMCSGTAGGPIDPARDVHKSGIRASGWQLFFFLGMVGWFRKAQDRDGVGERGYYLMEK